MSLRRPSSSCARPSNMTGGLPTGSLSHAAGRTLLASLAQCTPAAAAYGKCCSAMGKDVAAGACAKEFEALRKCVKQARRKL